MERHFLIAGGNSGIGLETVKRLRSEPGVRLTCVVRNPGPLAEYDDVETLPFDLAEIGEHADALPDTLHGFVYFPGSITLKPFGRLSDEDFVRDWEVNFLGAVRLLRYSLPALKKADRAGIILFSSVAAQTGLTYHASIGAAKGAVEGLARSLAAELAPRIRVNVIAPSLTDTPLAGSLLNSEEKAEAARRRHPLAEVGDPGDIADAVRFLLSESARFMTGQVVKMDGGLSSVRLL